MKIRSPSLIRATERYEEIIALWEAAGLSHRPKGRDTREAMARQEAGGSNFLIGVETEDGQLVGTVLATHDGRRGWLNRLAVHPDYRRQGIALQLIAAAEETLNAQGIDIIAALIEEDNMPSVAAFLSAGYVDWQGLHYMSRRKSDET